LVRVIGLLAAGRFMVAFLGSRWLAQLNGP
jgi:hypothetical protein